MPSSRNSIVPNRSSIEALEPRQLLAAAVSSSEILAQLKSSHGLNEVSAFLRSHPTSGLHQFVSMTGSKTLFRGNGLSTIQMTLRPGVSVNGAIKALGTLSQIKWVSPNYQYQRAIGEQVPNDPRFPQQTGQLDLIKVPQAWDTTTGAGVTVAVLDDGVDIDHEDLAANIWSNAGEIAGNGVDDDNNGYIDDVNGWDFGNGDNNPRPVLDLNYNFINSHGTQVAGILGAAINNNIGIAGVAGSVKIMPVRFTGYGVIVTSAGIAQSLAYAANNGAKIINISFSIDPYMNDAAFAAATDLAYSKGCLWLNSAGNSNVQNPPRFAIEKALFLANTSNVDVKEPTSNYGDGVDLAAPGVDVMGAVPGNKYDRALGTSFSTAVTSGVAALIWSAHPTWSRDQVASQLTGTADSIDAQNPTYIGKLGSGRVNALTAVTGSVNAPRMRGLKGIAEGSTIITPTTSLLLQLSNVLDASTITASAFELRFAGSDGIFDSNDTVVSLTQTNSYAIGTNLLKFTLPSELLNGKYRFTASSTIKDPFNNALDGNGDGTAGDDFVWNFNVDAAPTPPSGLTAVLPSYSQTEAELNWSDNSPSETGFILERSSTSDFAVINKTFTPIANSTRYNDWGLQQGTTYYYRIKAVGVNGASSPSNVASLVIPLPPAGIPATPGTLTAITPSYSQTEAELTWVDASNNETGFVIERSLTSNFAAIDKTFNAVPGSNRYNDWGLTLGQAYHYRVKAVNGVDSSAWSNTASVGAPVVETIPAAPTTLAVAPVAGSTTTSTVTWVDSSNNETKFELQRSTVDTFTVGTTTTIDIGANAVTYPDSGLVSGTTYYYRIRAVNSAGNSAYSNTAAFVAPVSIPSAPTTLTVAPVAGSTTTSTVTWIDSSNNETKFELQRSTVDTFTVGTTTTIDVAADAVTYPDSGLVSGTTYYYRIRAVNSAGNSAYSNTAAFVAPVSIPSAPTTLAVAAVAGSATSANLTWIDTANNETGFELQRSTTNTFIAGTTTTINIAANVVTYGDTGLTTGTTYYYQIRAVNVAGASAYSAVVSFTPAPTSAVIGNAGFETPTTTTYIYNPTGGTWTFNARSGVQRNGSAWGAVTAPDGVQTAFIQGSGGLGAVNQSVNFPAGTYSVSVKVARRTNQIQPLRFSVDGVQVGALITPTSNSFNTYTTATFTVSAGAHTISFAATDSTGDKSSFIDGVTINAVVPTPPAAPAGLTAVALGAAGARLAWTDNASNETGFEIQTATDAAFTTGLVTTTVGANIATLDIASGLTAGTTYYFRLRAINAVGPSTYSNTATFTPVAAPTAPTAPTGLTAVAGSSSRSIKLAWADTSNNETRFEIVRSTNSLFIGTTTINVAVNATTYTNTGLNNGTTYYYRIRAVNAVGNSAYSNTVSFRV